MGPDLWELFEDGKGDDEVAAIIRLGHYAVLPKGVRLVTQFSEIITIRTTRANIPNLSGSSEVADIAAGDTYFGPDVELETAGSTELSSNTVLPTDERRPSDEKATGRGVVVGLVDWGFDFAHPDFLNEDGTTRILALWDQRGSKLPNSPPPFGYGIVHSRDEINRALKQKDPYAALGYHPADADTGIGCHGTHVLSIAAGGGGEDRPTGIAPEADLVVVHNAPWDEVDTGRLGDSVTLLEGVDFISRIAGERPWVINLSMGRHGEQHDGSTLIEQGLDAAIRSAPGRAVCLSAGNYFDKRIHASGQLRPTQERTIIWEILENKPTNNQLEFWYSWQDKFEVAVRSPDGSIAARSGIGERSKFLVGGKEVGNVYHRGQEPNNLDNHITIYLYKDAPAGEWEVTLIGTDVIDGRYHAWIERDVSCASCQSRLHPDDADPKSTTGTICNGRRTLAVGAYNKHDPEMRLGHFSSVGPTRDGRLKPDLCAPGVSVLAARSAPREKHEPVQLLTRMSGTSMAAPHVTGTIALMFQAAPRRLRIEETHNLLLQSARKVSVPEDIPERIGIGFLDVSEAVDAARKIRAVGSTFKQTTVQSPTPAKPKAADHEAEGESIEGIVGEAALELFEGRAEAEFEAFETIEYQNTFHRIAGDITSAFEGGKTGTLNLYDLGVISYGKHQATLHSGTLLGILKRFTELSSTATSTKIATYLDRVKLRDESLREDTDFIRLLKDAAKELEMDRAQDEEFGRQYWEPAKSKAAKHNIKTALGHVIYYDTRIQGGLDQVAQSTATKLGGTTGQTVNGKEISELDSLRTFVDERIQRNLRISVYQKKQAAILNQAAQDLDHAAAADPSQADDLKKQAMEKRKKAKEYAANAAALEVSSKKTRGPTFVQLVTSGDLELLDGNDGKIYLKGKPGVVIESLKPGAAIDATTPSAKAEAAETLQAPVGGRDGARWAQSVDSSVDEILESVASLQALTGESDGDSSASRLSPAQQVRRHRDLVEAHRNPRAEIRLETSKPWVEGQVDVNESTDERRSLILWNFDIDGSYLKPEHEAAIRETVAWMASRKVAWSLASRGSGACRVFVSGFASHTGGREHNEILAKDREETTLAAIAAVLPADLASACDRGGNFDAFWSDPSVGENARRRAVRLVMQTPALPPPPPIPIDLCGNVKVWINAFIPESVPGYTFVVPGGVHRGKSAIPCPLVATPVNPNCPFVGYLTDQRTFSDSLGASVRMRSIAEISVAPPGFIRHPGFEQVTSGTTELEKSTGSVTCVRLADLTRCSFQNFRVMPDPAAPLSGNFMIKLSVKSSASDPCVNLAADIDYDGEITVLCSPRGGVVEMAFNGNVDSFPAFEMYASLNGVTKILFRVPPPKGNTVASLLGGASTPVTGRARFDLCRFAPEGQESEFALPRGGEQVEPAFAESLVELADQIIGEMEEKQSPVYVLQELFERSDSLEALATVDAGASPTAAQIFDSFVYCPNSRLAEQLGGSFEVIALPRESLEEAVCAGDVMVRRAEGNSAHVAIVGSPGVKTLEGVMADGLTPESRVPGQYVHVVEGGAFPHESEDKYARQLTDSFGRVLNDIVLLRLATAPPASSTVINVQQSGGTTGDPDSAGESAAAAIAYEDDVTVLTDASREMSLRDIADGNLGQLPDDILAAVMTRGENDANALANQVFWQKHPELNGKKLGAKDRSQQRLRAEWSVIYRRRVKPMIWLRAMIDEIDKYRGTIPRDFLLGWIAVESDGDFKSTTSLGELGYFQIMWKGGEAKDQLKLTEKEFKKLGTDPEFSFEKGIALAETYRHYILHTYRSVSDGTELLWRLTKGRHAASNALKSALGKLENTSAAITWDAVSKLLPRNIAENIDSTMDYAGKLKPFADLVPAPGAPAPVPSASSPIESYVETDQETFSDNAEHFDMSELPPVATRHQITINGNTLKYTAAAGRLPIKRGDGQAEALMFFVAYTLDGQNPSKRPLTFAFNGGPGSASLWLHMGALGPRKVVLQPDGFLPPAPYRIENNPYTLLDQSDLVFIDAIGTGFSRASDSQTFAKFWGVQGDIEAFSEFIRLYITRNERWGSPLFMLGESYGTMRAAGIAGYLSGKGISFNGITLLSSVLNYETLETSKTNDLPYIFLVPTFTMIAGYHNKLPADLAQDMNRARQESEKWASGEYAQALAKGDALTPPERQQVIEQMSRFTGLGKEVLDEANLRIDVRKFTHYLLLDQKLRVGRFDGRFTGTDPEGLLDTQFYDPTESSTHPPFTSVFNNYLHAELGYKTDMPYYTRAQDADSGTWNWGSAIGGFPDTSTAIRQAIVKNPFLKILVMEGYYDLATPFSAANYTINHLDLPQRYRSNISFVTYESGHMVYLPEAELKKMKNDQANFMVQSAADSIMGRMRMQRGEPR
jgi:carboxypeptidase C (cathepsin A)/subtilisin family serine protease